MSTSSLETLQRLSSLSADIFSLISNNHSLESIITKIVLLVQRATQIEAVGVRLADGLDYPYYFVNGFNSDFVEKEMHLCVYDAAGMPLVDSKGNPVLECMCGNVICGRFNPELPFFSPRGSFWSNNTTKLLASTTEADRQARTRNRCNGEGYESVALIPIKADATIWGLLQLNDHRCDMFTASQIMFLENVAAHIAIIFGALKTTKRVQEKTDDVVRLASVRIATLERMAELLHKEYRDETITEHAAVLEKLDKIISEIHTLKGVLPICCECKRVRTDSSYWQQIDQYIANHTKQEFTHTYCPDCYDKWRREELS